MMSYTRPCTCLCDIGSTLMRRTSPCTRIMGGRPDDRCRSEALFLTENASSWVMSMGSVAPLGAMLRPEWPASQRTYYKSGAEFRRLVEHLTVFRKPFTCWPSARRVQVFQCA